MGGEFTYHQNGIPWVLTHSHIPLLKLPYPEMHAEPQIEKSHWTLGHLNP